MYVIFLRNAKGGWITINLSDRRKAERLVRDITEGDPNYVFGYLYDPEEEYQHLLQEIPRDKEESPIPEKKPASLRAV